jgi:phosphoribosylaminoimidazole-succinocarboxamide synthase
MKKIPEKVAESNASSILKALGFKRMHQGKVRDTYELPNNELLVCATDRLSIFDFVLPVTIPRKGEYLTALTHFWLTDILSKYPNHLVYSEVYEGQNAVLEHLKTNPEFPVERCLVVVKKKVLPFELIYRHHIGGSVYKKYLETGMAGGQKIEPDLPKWSRLDEPIFTPSTKEDSGHDINIDAQTFLDQVPDGEAIASLGKQIYMEAYAYAKERGILILDTKEEMAEDGTIVDEILTTDSSRFVDWDDWKSAMEDKEDPVFYDKEVVREWGKTVETPFGVTGIHNLDPENSDHLAFVHSLEVPCGVISATVNRLGTIFFRITRKSLEQYQEQNMDIVV